MTNNQMERIFFDNKNEEEKKRQIVKAFELAEELIKENDTKIILYSNSLKNLKSFKNKGLEFFTSNNIKSCKYKKPVIIAIDVNFKSIEVLEETSYKSLFVITFYSQIDEFNSNWIDVWNNTTVIDVEGNSKSNSQITISDEMVRQVVDNLSEVNITHNNDISRIKKIFKKLKAEGRMFNSHEIYCYLIREKKWTYDHANEFENLIKKI